MVSERVCALIFHIAECVHPREEEAVAERNVLQRSRWIEAKEVLGLGQLVDLQVFRPALINFLPKRELDVG